MLFAILLFSLLAIQDTDDMSVLATQSTDGFTVLENRMESPYVSYTKSILEYGGQQKREYDTEANEWKYVNFVAQEVISEAWVNREDLSMIDVKWQVTVTNRLESPWTYRYFNYLLEVPICPVPGTVLRGNVYWDWIDAPDWYTNYSPEDERQQYLQPKNRYLFDNQSGFVDKWVQKGSTLFFNDREVVSKIYDAPMIGNRQTWQPPNLQRDIEWDGERWKWMFPEEENATINLAEMPVVLGQGKGFRMGMSFQVGGANFVRYDAEGNEIPPTEVEWIPNILVIRAHAKFKVIDPRLLEFPPSISPRIRIVW